MKKLFLFILLGSFAQLSAYAQTQTAYDALIASSNELNGKEQRRQKETEIL